MTKTNSMPPQLVKSHEARIERRIMISELMHDLLKESTQPLTALEVRKLIHQYTGHLYDEVHVRRILREMVDAKKISSRVETEQERFFRAGGRVSRGTPGRYFWAPAGEVPARTEVMAVDGMLLDSNSSDPTTKSSLRPRYSKKKSGPARASKKQTDSISELIDLIVSERVKPLQARIDELEKVLTGIKSALS